MCAPAIYEQPVNASRNKNTRRQLGHMWRDRAAEGGGGSGRPCPAALREAPLHAPLAPGSERCSPHIYGSPPAHLRRADRRRGRSGLRALHRPQLLLQEENMVTAGGVLHHQRGETEQTSPNNILISMKFGL